VLSYARAYTEAVLTSGEPGAQDALERSGALRKLQAQARAEAYGALGGAEVRALVWG
jgi:hypothetical protein